MFTAVLLHDILILILSGDDIFGYRFWKVRRDCKNE